MENIVKNYDLFIFDLDDTIIHTEIYHYESWIYTLKYYLNENYFITYQNFCFKFHSINIYGINDYLLNELKIDENKIDEIKNYKSEYYLNLIKNNKNKIKLTDGFEKLIELIIRNKKQFIIVTNAQKIYLDFFVDLFSVLKYSTKNYYCEMFKNKKPNPECYFKVIEDFPEIKKIGFEDSITGIEALSKISEIDLYFINKKEYYHYDFIINNYKITKHIVTFEDLEK